MSDVGFNPIGLPSPTASVAGMMFTVIRGVTAAKQLIARLPDGRPCTPRNSRLRFTIADRRNICCAALELDWGPYIQLISEEDAVIEVVLPTKFTDTAFSGEGVWSLIAEDVVTGRTYLISKGGVIVDSVAGSPNQATAYNSCTEDITHGE